MENVGLVIAGFLLALIPIYLIIGLVTFIKRTNNKKLMLNSEISKILIKNINVVFSLRKLCVHRIADDGLYLAPRVLHSHKTPYNKETASSYYIYGGSNRECEEYYILPSSRAGNRDGSSLYYIWKIYGEYFDVESQTNKKCVLVIEDKTNIELDKYILENRIEELEYKYVKQNKEYSIGYVDNEEKLSIADAFNIDVEEVNRLIESDEFVCLQAKYMESPKSSNNLKELANKALAYKYRNTSTIKAVWNMFNSQKAKRNICYLVSFSAILYLSILISDVINKESILDFDLLVAMCLWLLTFVLSIYFGLIKDCKRIIRIKKIKW